MNANTWPLPYDFLSVLADVITSRWRRDGREPSEEDRQQFLAGLEGVLAEEEHLRAYLALLDLLRAQPASAPPVTPAEEEAVSAGGLGALPWPRVVDLALAVPALLDLREYLHEELSPYWLEKINDTVARMARGQGIGPPSLPPRQVRQDRLAAAPLSGSTEPAGRTPGDFTRYLIPLSVGSLHQKGGAPVDPESVKLEVSVWPGSVPCRLEVRLFGGLSMIGDAACSGWVRDVGGAVVAEAVLADRRLTFFLPDPELAGRTLFITFQRGVVVLSIEVPLVQP
jgi:hypothetical protein